MKKHCVYNKSTKKLLYVSDGAIPEGFWLEDSNLEVFEYDGLEVELKKYELTFNNNIPSIVEIPFDFVAKKWEEIRKKRDSLLSTKVDIQKNYMLFGELSEQQIISLKKYRLDLLNVPQDIEAKIASGQISSVMDIDIETYPWPVLE